MTGENLRYEFGRNWSRFVRSSFTQERCDVAKRRILEFVRRESMEGLDFLDVGCGSGLHSLAAWQSGARKVHSFDYDPHSVAATRLLWERAGRPANWHVEQGDVLDRGYVESLGRWNFVYSWGVLHHTGEMWRAIENAQTAVAEDGLFYIALYSADADFQPSKEFWLDVKKKYNLASPIQRRRMEWWYVWNFYLDRSAKKVPTLLKRWLTYKYQRGMDLFADMRDWLGGWPMEYAGDQETVDFVEQRGFQLANVATGQACSEFLFTRSGQPAARSIVKEFAIEEAVPA